MKIKKSKAIIVIGPPGCGKSTLISLIQHPEVNSIKVGGLLRNEIEKNTNTGKEIKSYIDNGNLVPPDIVNDLVVKELSKFEEYYIFFDGFPRSVEEIDNFFSIIGKNNLSLGCIISLDLPLKEAEARILKRRMCENCGAIYNLQTFPPPKKDAELIKRDDDKREIVEKQIEEYKNKTRPVIEYFKKTYKKLFIEEASNRPPQILAARILARLKKYGVDLIDSKGD